MIKHICMMESKRYGNSWGVGDTREEANKGARKMLGQKPSQVQYKTCSVPVGRRLIVQPTKLGVRWWTEPAETEGIRL